MQQFSLSTWEYQEQKKALRYIGLRIKEKNSELLTYLAKHYSHYWAIQEKMQNPQRRKNMELVIHSLLQNDLNILAELKKISEDVLQKVTDMRNLLESCKTLKTPKTTFTLSEIRNSLREQYRYLKKQYEDAVDSKNFLMLKQVSPLTALRRAKNNFVHGGFDKLHAQQKSYGETLEQFEHDKSHFLLWQQTFNSQKWANTGDKLRELYYLTKKKFYLEETERKLAETKIWLDEELTRLENLCKTETAKEKIAFLAANFLFKNLKIAQEYETAKKLVSDLSEKLQVAEKRFYALNDNYSSLKKNYVYHVIQPVNDSAKIDTLNKNDLTGIIADALMRESYAVQLVARSSGNNLEMDKDWELMSELDKDEFIRKKIVREL